MLKNFAYAYSVLRSVNYFTQSSLLPLVEYAATKKTSRDPAQLKDQLTASLPKLDQLFKRDAQNIASGVYPAKVLFEESPVSHYARIPLLLKDAFRAAKQRNQKKAHVFKETEKDYLDTMPEYFLRNFHFQKDGYLSDESAALYDHQVEVLFAGTANAMRRMLIPALKRHFQTTTGEGLHFLEVGSGTGSLTRFIAMALPKAQITCVDLSPHYLARAKAKLKNFKRIGFLAGKAEDLNFKNNSFDAVFSCYLFHELPQEVRRQALAEKLRVLKPSGLLGITDSIQKDDDPSLNWALQQFPTQFHEPFYKNYVENKIEDELANLQVQQVNTEIGFLTKLVTATKV